MKERLFFMKNMRRRLGAAFLTLALVFSLLPTAALAAPRKSSRASGVTIDVTDYGADPTGAKESSTAVIEALAYAKTLSADTPKTISFPKGEYHFYADRSETRKLYVSNTIGTNQSYTNKRLGILLEDMKNVTVDGGGSQFIFHGDMTAFATIRSTNIVFENFDMDYASPSVIDVTVESKVEGENAVIVYVPACYTYEIVNGSSIRWTVEGSPAHSGTNDLGQWGQMFDMAQGITTRSGGIVSGGALFRNASAIAQVGDDPTHLKVSYSSAGNLPNVGYCYQIRNTTRTTPGAFLWESENITVRDMNIQYLHGFGLVGQLSKTVTIDNVKFQARPGSGRSTAGFADFIQMSSVGGKVTITNCDFSNPHDDPINIHGTFLKVTNISSDRRTVTVKYMHSETAGFPQYYPGDTVDFSTLGTMIPVANSARTVESVQNPAADATGDDALRTIVVTLNEAIPSGITANNYVMENVTYTPEVEIKNCRFVETPTRGVLVTTRKPVVIENNYFDRMGMAAIFISCDAQSWWESGRCEDVTIRGNTFIIQPRFRGDALADAGILVGPTNGTDDASNQIHKNLLIENNTFYMARDVYAIYAKSVNTLTVRNNLFQRYDPDVSMTLTPGTASIAVGGSQATSLSATGTRYSNKLFYLQACKNVTFDGNSYDDGLNLGAGLASITTASDVTVTNGDAVAVNTDKQLDAVGTAGYFSSDPSVATVDQSGVVTGVSAGTAEVWAYRAAGARMFESNHVTVTVTGGGSGVSVNKIDVTSDKDILDVNGTAAFTATTDPAGSDVIWSVKPVSEGAAASITQAGVLTATAPGVVEVVASAGETASSKLVSIRKPQALSPTWTVNREVAGSWTLDAANNKVTITPQSGGDWGSNDSGGHDFFLMNEVPSGDFEITVRVNDFTCRQSNCWCEAGLVAWVDKDNYVSVCRKNANGSGSLAISKEVSGSPGELKTSNLTQQVVYLKLVKSGTTYTGHYSADGSSWTQIAENGTNSYTASLTNPKIGFYSCNAGDPHSSATYTITLDNFTLGGTPVSLVDSNTAPSAGAVTATPNSSNHNVAVTYTYTDAESDGETGSVIAWYVSNSQDGHYTRLENASSDILNVNAATSEKWVKAVVVPRDATGRFGAPVTSAAVQAPAAPVVQDDASLSTLSVTGQALTPAFDPNVTAYTVNLPRSAGQVRLEASAAQRTATVTGAGQVTLDGATTTATVTVTAPDRTTRKVYTVTINRAQGSDASLSGLTAQAGDKSISYTSGTRYYQMVVGADASTLNFTAAKVDPSAKVAVRFNNQELGEYAALDSRSLPLTPGLNHLELRVTSEDEASMAIYRVQVTKPASGAAELTSLSMSGQSVAIPAEGTDLGLLATAQSGKVTLNAAVSAGATLRISVDGKPMENGAEFTVTGLSQVNLRVVAEDGATEKVYTLALSKPDPANADLYSLKLGGMTLSPAFDPSIRTYTASFEDNRGTAPLTALTVQPNATVTCETVSIYETATGKVALDCHFFRDVSENFVKLTVTSPNGSVKKEYLVNVTYQPVIYLSDLTWESHSSGWSSGWPNPGVDIGVENKAMVLRGPNGLETIKKGLGTHADSTTVFDLSGKGFTRFTAKVGPNQNSGGSPHISFEVQDGNGNQLWASTGEITHSDNYQVIDIDVTGVSKLKLLDKQTTNNANAHANWGDAKFYGTQIGPAIANTDVSIQHVEFEHEEHTIYANEGDANHTAELHPVFKPVGVDLSAHQKVLNWASNAPTVATVVGGADNKGVVTAVKPGTATITATAISGATDSCTITVKWKLQGTPTVSGELEYGSELTANVNTFAQDAKENLEYTWYRGASATGTAIGHAKTYTPVEADIGQKLTVKVSGKEGSFYEGAATATTGTIEKADGLAMKATPTHRNVSAEGGNDGAITGLFKGRAYQYLLWDFADGEPPENADWKDFCDTTGDETSLEGTHGTAEITGLGVGNYVVRRAEDDTHKPGPISNTVSIVVRTPDMYDLTNPHDFEGGVVQARRTQIPENDTVRLVVTPEEGYELDTLTVTPTEGDPITPTKGDEAGVYTFTMPSSNVTISATFRKVTLTIEHDIQHMTCNMAGHDHTVSYGDRFSITLTPEDGYEMTPTTITVIDSDSGEAFTDYTYLADESDPAKRVLTFEHGVTRNIKITGTPKLKDYTVVYALTNGLTAPGAAQTVQHGKDLSATLVAARGYDLPEEITVTVAGTAPAADKVTYNADTGVLTVSQVEGNVVITAAGAAQDLPLQTVTLVGPARVGRTLTVNTVPVLAAVDYQWFLVDEDGVESPLAGTARELTIPAEAEGKTILVRVTGKNGYTGTLTSAPTAAILAAAEPFVFVTGIVLSPWEATVAAGKSVSISAEVTPDNATAPALFWSSDNEAVATVDQNGRVTGVSEGTATITAASTDTALETRVYAYCAVTVTKAETPSRPSGGGSTAPAETTKTETRDDGAKVTTVTKPDGSKVETVEQADGSKTEAVTSAKGDVTITATDAEGETIAKVEIPAAIPAPETKFEDLDPVPWAEEAINHAAGLELVKGIGDNKYDPITPMTRGSLATVLHRLSQGKTDYAVTFKDVAAGKYYTEGVAWAAKVNVVKGISEDVFAPDDIITREQLAVMLARYANLLGMNTKADAHRLSVFTDGDKTGEWAVDGVAWCVEKGILKGKGQNNLDPTANVSRAEVAVMLDRFIALIK